jgi:hypothetical protein
MVKAGEPSDDEIPNKKCKMLFNPGKKFLGYFEPMMGTKSLGFMRSIIITRGLTLGKTHFVY